MDIGEIRAVLEKQYIEASCDAPKGRRFRRALRQVAEDIQELDNIMMRNFGVAYNAELQIYE